MKMQNLIIIILRAGSRNSLFLLYGQQKQLKRRKKGSEKQAKKEGVTASFATSCTVIRYFLQRCHNRKIHVFCITYCITNTYPKRDFHAIFSATPRHRNLQAILAR